MTETHELKCTADEAIAKLRSLWDITTEGFRLRHPSLFGHLLRRGGEHTPEPAFTTPALSYDFLYEQRIDNPLWNVAKWFPTMDDRCWCTKLPKAYGYLELSSLNDIELTRNGLSLGYSFSIPTPGDLRWLKGMIGDSSIIELGAGRGYWAYMLKQVGFTVHAYDPLTPGEDNEYFKSPGTFTEVLRRDQRAVDDHPTSALMLVWPGYDDPWCEDALERYRGDTVVYVGEGYGGCTGTDAFHERLEKDWEWLGTSPAHLTWWGIHDQLTIYTRKQRVLAAATPRAALTKGE